jgi:hypothetical protein
VQISSNLLNWSTLFITNSPPMPFSWTDTNRRRCRRSSIASKSARHSRNPDFPAYCFRRAQQRDCRTAQVAVYSHAAFNLRFLPPGRSFFAADADK